MPAMEPIPSDHRIAAQCRTRRAGGQAKEAGREPDPRPGIQAKQRSVQNNYLTLPVLLTMLAGHFPFAYGADDAWLVLVALIETVSALSNLPVLYFGAPDVPGTSPGGLLISATILLSPLFAIAAEVVKDALEVVGASGQEATPDVRQGPPGEAILAAAHTHTADLIILGSRSLSREPTTEALLGSVASTVLRNAACPVLVVP